VIPTRITYLYNSGFLIETRECDILIDYYRGGFKPKRDKKLYTLASHSHGDHYSPSLRKFGGSGATYILSSDIRFDGDNVNYLSKGGVYEDENLRVDACGSTDAGISFLLKISEKRVFHAGDLNNWHWKEESTPEEIAEAELAYLAELEYIAGLSGRIDVVFFPVDPRLGSDYWLGALQFIKRIETVNFIPMHFGERYEKANAFAEHARKYGANFIEIKRPGTIGEIL